jgi:glycosyltransferase involved in cell wall biosynthesis
MNPEEIQKLAPPEYLTQLPATKVKVAIIDIVGMSYDGDTLNKKGLGGSESAVILISQHLAKIGFDVTVFNGCNEDGAVPGKYNDVVYRPLTDISTDQTVYEVVISSRAVTPFVPESLYHYNQTTNRKIDYQHFENIRKNARLKVFWMHDTFCWGDDILESLVSKNFIDEIWTLSDFHAMYVMNCSHPHLRNYEVLRDHMWTTRNGLVKYFDHVDINTKDPNLFIFNANMSKGLDPLLNLVWPRIKQEIPDARLIVIGGFYKLGSAFAHDNEESEFMKIAGIHMDDFTITFTGIISQQEVAEISARASYFIYPAALPETYGISTIEALYANTPLLTCRFGALGETATEHSYAIDYAMVPNGLYPNINTQQQVDLFVKMVVDAYNNPIEHRRRMQALDEIKDLVGWEVTALEWKQHIYSKLGLYLSREESKQALYTRSKYHEIFQRKLSTSEEWVAPKQTGEQPIVVVSPFYNAENYIEKCILSVAAQNYENYEHWLIDDASTDHGYSIAQRLIQQLPENIKGKFRLFRNEDNRGAVANHVNAIRNLDDSIIVMLLDGDDSLINRSDVFDYYNYVHQNYDFTHGSSWSMVDSIPLVSQPYPPEVHGSRSYRAYKFNWNMPYTHLRTLKARLLKYEPDSVFQDSNGSWYKAGGDNATFYRALENADPGRVYVVSDIVYNYNDVNPLNDYKVNRTQQDTAIVEILTEKKTTTVTDNILELEYQLACQPTVKFANGLIIDNDIYEHLPTLLDLANECETVTEFGVRWGYSTRAFLLSRSKLLSYDLELDQRVVQLFDVARGRGKDCAYSKADTLELTIDETDLLFIDTEHSYGQLRAELDRHHTKAKKYIAFHDTYTYGTTGEATGDRKGLLTAIIEFMRDHPEWKFKYHATNNNGLTIIERTNPAVTPAPKKRILLAIPTNRNIEAQTFKSIYDLEVPDGYQVDFQYFWGYQVDQVRNLIADWIIRYNYDYLFSIDSDIAFPADTLKKMLNHDVDMVSGIYIQRIPETHTIEIMRRNTQGGITHVNFADIAGQGLVPIDASGFGCLLIKSKVFKAIPYPHFVYKSAIDHANTFSEDVYFCTQATDRGFKIWADTSIICDHIGSWTFRVNTKINEPKLPSGTPLRLETDSDDYYILKNAVKMTKGVPGMLCEIGTRRGGSLKLIIDTLLENEDHNRNVIGLDPYGNLEYISSEGQSIRYDYNNAMRNETFVALYSYIQGKPVNLVMHVLEDTEFFKRFSDGVAFYNDQKNYETQYSFVFFDGPHDVKSIIAEMEFFNQRSSTGAIWVLDDIHVIPYNIIKEWLQLNNFVTIEESKIKASYKKM